MGTVKNRYRLIRRENGVYYLHDNQTGKRESLRTKDSGPAERLLNARNESHRNPDINRRIAEAYMCAADPDIETRDWAWVMEEMLKFHSGDNRKRWERAIKDKAYDPLRSLPLWKTRPENILDVIYAGTVSTNTFLRRLHNLAVDMAWLPRPVVPKKRWPKVEHGRKRAITADEHRRIIEREMNEERRALYELLWHLGASQSDAANLKAENIDWEARTISFSRKKTGTQVLISFGSDCAKVLKSRPAKGWLFPELRKIDCKYRATEFRQRCDGLGISGVTMHSYRYSWAQRAKLAGMPERYAQQCLGHASKAIHEHYANSGQDKVPSLEELEAAKASDPANVIDMAGSVTLKKVG